MSGNMLRPRLHLIMISLLGLVLLLQGFSSPNLTTQAASSFADPAFQGVWQHTDLPVASQSTVRTWIWGPGPNQTLFESYNGHNRQVEYFDKSRMEINDPAADRKSQWFVTNGLLAKELVSGEMQLGDNSFEKHAPAAIPVAGDSDDANGVTYASLNGVTTLAPGQNVATDQTNSAVNGQLNRAGVVSAGSNGTNFGVHYANFEAQSGHNIPNPFWDFLHATGPIVSNGQTVNGALFDPLYFVTGLPLSEAYWIRSKVGGVERDVLVQVFERRVLTYTPTNEPQWQVEMGNIGQHYYQWRYGSAPATPYDSRFGFTITGAPDSAGIDHELATLGGAPAWYSYDYYNASASAMGSRAIIVKTGHNYGLTGQALTNLAQSVPPGTTWLIGNEPNVPGQDEATPAEYASQYRAIRDTIRAVDPGAKMVGPNVLNWNYTCDGCPGYTQADGWVAQMLQAYHTQTGQDFDPDAWGIHTYGLNWNHLPLTDVNLDIKQVTGLRQFLSGQAAQKDKPIWITEFGVIWGYDGINWVQVNGNWRASPTGPYRSDAITDYLRTYGQWLVANAKTDNIGKWFVYTSYGSPEDYTDTYAGLSLFSGAGTDSTLTSFGQLYLSLAQHTP